MGRPARRGAGSMSLEVREQDGGIVIAVRVQPGAKRSKIVGLHGSALKIAVAAPPVDGKANAALIEFLCDNFKLRKSQIEIIRGQTSRDKVVLIRDIEDSSLGKLIISVQKN